MSNHVSAANAHRTLAGVYFLGFALLAVFLLAATATPPDVALTVSIVPAVLFIGVHMLIARGADACKPWARTASIVIGVLCLPAFPIGTGLGIWLLSNSLTPWTPEKKYAGSLTDGWPQPQQEGA